jgi:hypothetical protein
MKSTQVTQQDVCITPSQSDKCYQHHEVKKIFNISTDQDCTYTENVLHYHIKLFFSEMYVLTFRLSYTTTFLYERLLWFNAVLLWFDYLIRVRGGPKHAGMFSVIL